MIRIRGFQTLLIFISFTSIITVQKDYFKYTGPNLTTTDNETFTEFYLVDDNNVLHVLTQDTKFTNYFPKCCPPNYKYEKVGTKCVKSNDTSIMEMLDIEVNLIKSGLKNCEVIVDHVLIFDDFNNLLGSNKLMTYENETFQLGRYCVDGVKYDDEFQSDNEDVKVKNRIILRLCYYPEYCTRGLKCLCKCCPDGEIFSGSKCILQPEYGFPIEFYKETIVNLTDNFAIYSAIREEGEERTKENEEGGHVKLSDDIVNTSIHENGSISYGVRYDTLVYYDVELEMYCCEFSKQNELIIPEFRIFFHVEYRQLIFKCVTIFLSCLCFIVTMGVYIFLYKLAKVAHRIIFFYCITLFTTQAMMMYLYLYVTPGTSSSWKVLGIICLFGYLSELSWSTAMFYDMWRTFGSMTSSIDNVTNVDGGKTLYYCLYGWLVPTSITIFCYYKGTYNFLPAPLGVLGEMKTTEEFDVFVIYIFIFEVCLTIIANTIFFILIIRYFVKTTNDVRKRSDSEKDKQKATSALKERILVVIGLFLAIGINSSYYIILAFISNAINQFALYVELLLFCLDCLQAVVVLTIFVRKCKSITSFMVRVKANVVNSISRLTSVCSSSN